MLSYSFLNGIAHDIVKLVPNFVLAAVFEALILYGILDKRGYAERQFLRVGRDGKDFAL